MLQDKEVEAKWAIGEKEELKQARSKGRKKSA